VLENLSVIRNVTQIWYSGHDIVNILKARTVALPAGILAGRATLDPHRTQ